MKTLSLSMLCVVLLANILPLNAQPTSQPIKIVNKSNCDLNYAFVCTEDGCETDNFTSGPSGVVLANTETLCELGCGSDFAAMRFSFSPPTGTGVTHYITFSDQLANDCTGYEECNSLWPAYYQAGTIETGCLGSQGEIRADIFTENDCCTIYFKYSN